MAQLFEQVSEHHRISATTYRHQQTVVGREQLVRGHVSTHLFG
jgi:hypothetical protein